jgi:hypothetical protein
VTRIAPALLRDEVLELLAERPDLVAVADAVSATQARPRRGRRGGIAVAAGLAAALIVAFWQGGSSPSFAVRAEAAIGTGPVLHVVVEAPAETTVVELASGAETALRVRIEYRYDTERRRLRTSVSRGGRVTDDVLRTARSRPELDPALVGFVSGYRQALATKRPVKDVVGGRRVLWLEFGTGASRERVAIDPQTLTPLFIESLVGAHVRWHVREIRARERRASDFVLPAPPDPQPIGGSVVESRRVALLRAPWLRVGVIDGVKLVSADVEQLVRGYAAKRRPAERGVGARLRYRGSAGFVEIQQAPRREPAYAYLGGTTFSGTAVPAPGRVVLVELPSAKGGSRWLGQLRSGPIFVTIWATSRPLVLAAARALEPQPRRGR